MHVGLGMTGLITVNPAPAGGSRVGDLDDGHQVSGPDVQGFISCFRGADPAATGRLSADLNTYGGSELEDVSLFVDRRLDALSPACWQARVGARRFVQLPGTARRG